MCLSHRLTSAWAKLFFKEIVLNIDLASSDQRGRARYLLLDDMHPGAHLPSDARRRAVATRFRRCARDALGYGRRIPITRRRVVERVRLVSFHTGLRWESSAVWVVVLLLAMTNATQKIIHVEHTLDLMRLIGHQPDTTLQS